MAQRFKREILPATEERPQIELVRSARRTRTISLDDVDFDSELQTLLDGGFGDAPEEK